MTKQYTDAEYAKRLPKKQVGTAVLFFNDRKELLVVKPNYREGWLVPGGAADANESPLKCAIREVYEEIGLVVTDLPLIGIYYGPKKTVFADSLKFIYNGGTLSYDQTLKLKLQTEELDELAFLSIQNALPLLTKSLQDSIPACLEAMASGTTAYSEGMINA